MICISVRRFLWWDYTNAYKLVPAPRSIARRLVISETAVLPTVAENQTQETYRNPPRPSYPKGTTETLLQAIRSNMEQPLADDAMVLDEQVVEEPAQETAKQTKGKKRKDDGTGETKKAKKPKEIIVHLVNRTCVQQLSY